MTFVARTALLATAGALALTATGLAAGGLGTANADPTRPAANSTAAPARGLTPQQRATLRSIGHLSLVRQTRKHGDVTVLVQRGMIEAVGATSITLRSKDGYQHSYVISAVTKVRERRQPVAVGALHTGERAMVVAVTTPHGDVARRIACLRPV